MIRARHILITTLIAASAAAFLRAEAPPSPAAQAEAPEWLEIRISKVASGEADDTGNTPIQATAEVITAYKSPSGLKAGDTITIAYTHNPRPATAPGSGRPMGPSGPMLLREGRTTAAFLTLQEDEEKTYAPGAGAWSFAPPFGISPEDREKYGIKAPMPPSTPPPPPPAFRAPLKGPPPPASPIPSSTPPPPPASVPSDSAE